MESAVKADNMALKWEFIKTGAARIWAVVYDNQSASIFHLQSLTKQAEDRG